MAKVYKFKLTCPECHQEITGQMEHQVVADNRVPEFLAFWQQRHIRVCPSRTKVAPELDGYQLYGETESLGSVAEQPTRTIFTARS